MGKSRNVGKQRRHLKGNGLGDAPIYIGYLRQLLEKNPPVRDGELGYFEDVILQQFCVRMVKLYPDLPTDQLIAKATCTENPSFEMLKTDLGGVSTVVDIHTLQFISHVTVAIAINYFLLV